MIFRNLLIKKNQFEASLDLSNYLLAAPAIYFEPKDKVNPNDLIASIPQAESFKFWNITEELGIDINELVKNSEKYLLVKNDQTVSKGQILMCRTKFETNIVVKAPFDGKVILELSSDSLRIYSNVFKKDISFDFPVKFLGVINNKISISLSGTLFNPIYQVGDCSEYAEIQFINNIQDVDSTSKDKVLFINNLTQDLLDKILPFKPKAIVAMFSNREVLNTKFDSTGFFLISGFGNNKDNVFIEKLKEISKYGIFFGPHYLFFPSGLDKNTFAYKIKKLEKGDHIYVYNDENYGIIEKVVSADDVPFDNIEGILI